MLIAQEKLKNNIAEYILYMWRVEDVIRALKFDIEALKASVILPQSQDEEVQNKIINWYSGLIKDMRLEGIAEKGHLTETQEKIQELNFLHFTLLQNIKDKAYTEHCDLIQKDIQDFKKKSKMEVNSDVEVCLHALNMKLLLKLQKKEISTETDEAFKGFAKLLAMLSKKYKSQFDIVN